MNARRWIAERPEQPPVRLRARLDEVTGVAVESVPAADALAAAGRDLVGSLLAAGATARDAALDLLAADALVTYAFEAAADDPASLDARAAATMRAIAALVPATPAPDA